jgi:integrase/recombinase XerD
VSESFDVVGPLKNYWHGFLEDLESQGYLPRPIQCQMALLAHASRFMEREGIALGDFGDEEARRLMAERRAGGFSDRLSDKALIPLLDHLRRLGVVPGPVIVEPTSWCIEIIASYVTYLRNERGLIPYTVGCYARYAKLLLDRLGGEDGAALAAMNAGAVINYVASESGTRRVQAAKQFANATRWFLRYLHMCGLIDANYSMVVPSVAGWQQTAIPKGVPRGSIEAALAALDQESVTGKRDYALIYLISRLGLRGSEAVALTIDEIDWRRGTLFLRGKGHRDELMPLPADVGEVLAGYLADTRQRRRDRFVFQRVHAPVGGLSRSALNPIVSHAFERAGFVGVTPHCLRHAAASEMLRRGGSLAEIGQVLRHRSAASTAMYAKVDYGELAVFARPWPGTSR